MKRGHFSPEAALELANRIVQNFESDVDEEVEEEGGYLDDEVLTALESHGQALREILAAHFVDIYYRGAAAYVGAVGMANAIRVRVPEEQK